MDMVRGRVGAFDRLARIARSAHRLSLLVALWAATVLVWHMQAASAGDPIPQPEAYRLGVFPYLPVLAIDRIYGPVAAQFAEDLGRPVHLKTKPTFDKFADELRNETYDIILVHPFFYVEARDEHHYEPLARLEEPLTAVVMVRDGEPFETLADLEGETIGLPPPLAAVTELIRASLIDAGLVPGVNVTLEHYRSKPSCLQAVASGRTAACGLPRFALAQMDPNNERKLRLMFETEPVSNFLFAAHARVPESVRIDLCKSILSWPFTAKGRKILEGGAWSRFVMARDQDYDEIRRHMQQFQRFAGR
jgi:ABC-type phosphate/phosphonate transport system substrate-binding protein